MSEQQGPKRISRREFLAIGTATAASAVLAACGPSTPAPEAESGAAVTEAPAVISKSKEILYWHSYTQPERVAFMEKAAADFEAKTGTKVNIEVVPWPAFPQKWPSAHAANQLPDLAVMTPEHSVAMWEAGALYSTKDVIDLLGGPEAFKPGILEKTSIWRDNYVAFPHYAHARLLLQRADLLEEAGYPADDFESASPTWDEAIAAAEAMTSPPDRYGWIFQLNKADYGGVLVLQQLMRSNGAEFFDADGNVTFDSQEARECVDFMYEIYKRAHPPGAVEYRVQDAFNLVNSGKSAFSLETAFVLSVASRDAPDIFENLRGGYPPQKKTVGWVAEPICMATPKGNNPDGAKEYAKFLLSEEYYVPFVHTIPGGMYPSIKSVAESDAFWDNPIIQKLKVEAERTLEGMEKGAQVGFDYGPNPFAQILKTGITEEMVQRVFLENVPVDQAVAETAAKMKEQADDIKSRLS